MVYTVASHEGGSGFEFRYSRYSSFLPYSKTDLYVRLGLASAGACLVQIKSPCYFTMDL